MCSGVHALSLSPAQNGGVISCQEENVTDREGSGIPSPALVTNFTTGPAYHLTEEEGCGMMNGWGKE